MTRAARLAIVSLDCSGKRTLSNGMRIEAPMPSIALSVPG